MPTPTIPAGNLFMNATLYTGTGATQAITNGVSGTSFQPDLVWVKSRSAATDHKLTDSVRGTTKGLISNTTGAETTDTNGLTAFGTSGFTVGSDTNYNNSAATYVGWQWKAGGTAVTNTSGSISSQVSANTTSGFSVVTYTGTGVNATVGHGLGAVPSMIIVKRRNTVDGWFVYNSNIGNTDYLRLNTTAASATFNFWQNTTPTSSVFSISTDVSVNASSDTYVAYCWTPIDGYSAFGSYTGNALTDGPFVYTGFRPRFIMWKNSSAAEAWLIEDTARSTYNEVALELYPSSSGAEVAGSSRLPTQQFDYLSNGFKVRGAQSQTNGSGNTIIYMAFAENPFKYANAR